MLQQPPLVNEANRVPSLLFGIPVLKESVVMKHWKQKGFSVANDHDSVEREAGLGAVPGDELVNGVLIHAARGWRTEAVEHGQFAMIQIRQP
jgi:hypothetical protein